MPSAKVTVDVNAEPLRSALDRLKSEYAANVRGAFFAGCIVGGCVTALVMWWIR